MDKQQVTDEQLDIDIAKCRKLVKKAVTQPEPTKAFDFKAHIDRLKTRRRRRREATGF